MANLQKVNLPKSQLSKKVNSLKTPTIAFWLFYAQVDFLASWLFGGWPFLLVSFWNSIMFSRFYTDLNSDFSGYLHFASKSWPCVSFKRKKFDLDEMSCFRFLKWSSNLVPAHFVKLPFLQLAVSPIYTILFSAWWKTKSLIDKVKFRCCWKVDNYVGNFGFIISTGQNSKLVKWQVDKMTWHRWIYSQEKFRDQSFAKSSPLYQIAKIDLFSFHHSPGGIIHSGKEQKLLFIFFKE